MLSRVLVLLLATAAATVTAAYRRKVLGCEGATVQLFCEDEKVIRVLRANYGRISASVCPAASSGSWSTRCIQPTTLRQVAARCSGAQAASCSLAVTSRVFGDPCPDTPKYLEVVYTCETSAAASETPEMPPWLLSLEAISASIMKKATTTTTTTTTSTTTAAPVTTKDEDYIGDDDNTVIVIETNEIPAAEAEREVARPSSKFLRYLELMKERHQEARLGLVLNNPRQDASRQHVPQQEAAQESVAAAVVIAALATLALLAAVTLGLCFHSRRGGAKTEQTEQDSESTVSSSYLPYSASAVRPLAPGPGAAVILGRDGRLYQQVLLPGTLAADTGDKHEYAEISSNYNQYWGTPHKL